MTQPLAIQCRRALLFLAMLIVLQGVAPLPTSAAVAEPSAQVLQPSLSVIGELWRNASGGVQTGSRWNSLVELGLDLDLAALHGPSGATVTAQLNWVENQHAEADFGNLTGATNPVSGLNAADHWRLFNLFYHQTWADGRFALKIGQLAIDDDFMGSDFAGLFAHSALGAMPSQVATPHGAATSGGSAYPIFAVAAPGVHFAAKVDDKFALQLGVYHGGPGPDERSNHGFAWDTGSGQGVVVFYEGTYAFSLAGKPSTLRAGGAIHSGRFEDFAALATDKDAPEVRGLHSFYVIQDLVLLSTDADHPTLGAFWRAGLSPQQDRSVVHRYADAGLNWFAPLPGRADDIAGLAVSYTEYGDAFRRLDPALAAAETALELTYRAQLTEHFALQAIAQRHFNPLAGDSGRRPAANVLGLRAELSF